MIVRSTAIEEILNTMRSIEITFLNQNPFRSGVSFHLSIINIQTIQNLEF